MEAYYAFSDEAGQYENTCGKRFLKSHPYYVPMSGGTATNVVMTIRPSSMHVPMDVSVHFA